MRQESRQDQHRSQPTVRLAERRQAEPGRRAERHDTPRSGWRSDARWSDDNRRPWRDSAAGTWEQHSWQRAEQRDTGPQPQTDSAWQDWQQRDRPRRHSPTGARPRLGASSSGPPNCDDEAWNIYKVAWPKVPRVFRNSGDETPGEQLHRLTVQLGTALNAAWVAFANIHNGKTKDPRISDQRTCTRFLNIVERHDHDVRKASGDLGIRVNWEEVLANRKPKS